MKLSPLVFAAAALFLGLFGAFYVLGSHPGGERTGVLSKTAWQRMASPGELIEAHAFLEHNCAACHTPVKGAEASKCIACHADNESLLQRQPTAFHADVGSCRECHPEHQGAARLPTIMDHVALAMIGLRPWENSGHAETGTDTIRKQLVAWIDRQESGENTAISHHRLTPLEATLDCAACHSKKDRHLGLFGQDCAQCHAAAQWTIPEFRHPSPRSTDCAQCHQAPPSHYMGHFHMVSMRVAGKPHARVEQCHLCHQTTAWNDIKGVGWYKHH